MIYAHPAANGDSVSQMLDHRFERSARWMALAASVLCCACSSSRNPSSEDGGAHQDAGSVAGKESHGGGGTGGKAGRSGSGGTGGAADGGGEWPDAGCTFGQDHTCNDNPAMTAISGTCSKNGTCSCNTGFAISPESGKCAAYTPKPGDPCKQSSGCNDNPISSVRAGVCLSDGSCHCLGTAVKNPDTGLCKPQ